MHNHSNHPSPRKRKLVHSSVLDEERNTALSTSSQYVSRYAATLKQSGKKEECTGVTSTSHKENYDNVPSPFVVVVVVVCVSAMRLKPSTEAR